MFYGGFCNQENRLSVGVFSPAFANIFVGHYEQNLQERFDRN